jgi:hypothetical protein
MRGVYTLTFREQSFTAANGDYDFFEITPADDRPVELIGLLLAVKSEVGDAQDEMVSYGIVTVASTPASTGTAIEMMNDTFNVRAGLQLWLPEEYRVRVDQADVMACVRLWTALADDATISGTAWVREV